MTLDTGVIVLAGQAVAIALLTRIARQFGRYTEALIEERRANRITQQQMVKVIEYLAKLEEHSRNKEAA